MSRTCTTVKIGIKIKNPLSHSVKASTTLEATSLLKGLVWGDNYKPTKRPAHHSTQVSPNDASIFINTPYKQAIVHFQFLFKTMCCVVIEQMFYNIFS